MNTPRLKTYDRIIEASLALFNEQGERNITTNHIAAHLGISPGNLYYHFHNKEEIIHQIFGRYRLFIAQRLAMPVEHTLSAGDLVNYLDAAFQAMWQFRFMFYDLPNLLARNPQLQADYHHFVDQELHELLKQLFQGLVQSGLLKLDEQDIQPLITNIWLIVKFWYPFVQGAQPAQPITEADSYRGALQVLALLKPYIQPEFQPLFQQMATRYVM